MKCPACQKPAISFTEWGSGNNWRRYRCPHCSVDLKATRRTWLFALACLGLIPFHIWLSNRICAWTAIDEHIWGRWIFGALVIPCTIGIGYYAWKTGSYALAAKVEKCDSPP